MRVTDDLSIVFTNVVADIIADANSRRNYLSELYSDADGDGNADRRGVQPLLLPPRRGQRVRVWPDTRRASVMLRLCTYRALSSSALDAALLLSWLRQQL